MKNKDIILVIAVCVLCIVFFQTWKDSSTLAKDCREQLNGQYVFNFIDEYCAKGNITYHINYECTYGEICATKFPVWRSDEFR
jgi:hypothetical protein